MIGAYAQVGARLVDRGYAAISIVPGTKRPSMMNWREEYTRRLPTQHEMDSWSNVASGVCVVTGPGSQHTVAVDIDVDDAQIVSAIVRAIPGTTVRKKGKKGETLFYRGPLITSSPSWNVNGVRVCDLIGPGRQTVLPPTIHPDTGAPYVWTGPDALEDVDPAELPELTPAHVEAIGEALRPFGYAGKQSAPVREDTAWNRLNDLALRNLDKWIPHLNLQRCQRTTAGYEAVATWRASNTGNHIDKRKLNLKIHPDGITDFGDGPKGYSSIDLVMQAQCVDFDSAFEWLEKFVDRSPSNIVVIDLKMSRHSPAAPASAPDHDPVTGEVIELKTHHRAPSTSESIKLPQLARDCPGLVGEIVEWICSTSRRPDPVLALGVAVSVIGTLVGRQVCGPTESATHLYVIGLAPTGAGKQHPLNCVSQLMIAAKAEEHIGPSEFISMPAVINFLLRKPLSICPQDEFGAFLKRANSKRASGFEAAISKILRSAWGSSFQPMKTPEWAGREMATINAPALSLFGVSTPEEFYSALQGEDVSNGFLNRLLILESGARSKQVTPEIEFKVPEYLANSLRNLYPADNSVMRSRLNDVTCVPEPRKIEWANEKAKQTFCDFSDAVDDERDAHPELDPFLSRAAEIGIRLATIRALGRWRTDECIVDVSDVEWGRDISYLCASRVAKTANDLMVTDMNHGQLVNKIISVIRKRKGRAPHLAIVDALKKNAKSKEIKATLETLIEGGAITKELVPPPAGGPPMIWYCMAA